MSSSPNHRVKDKPVVGFVPLHSLFCPSTRNPDCPSTRRPGSTSPRRQECVDSSAISCATQASLTDGCPRHAEQHRRATLIAGAAPIKRTRRQRTNQAVHPSGSPAVLMFFPPRSDEVEAVQ